MHFIVPGPLTTRTGGFVYDRTMLAHCQKLGLDLNAVELSSPDPSAVDRARLAALSKDRPWLVDGLVLPALVRRGLLKGRDYSVLIHHPCSFEPGAHLDPSLHPLEARGFKGARRIVCTSHHTASRLGEFGVEPSTAKVVHPGSEAPDPPASVRTGPLRSMLCVATLTQRKGHDLLLDALGSSPMELELTLAGSRHFEPEWATALLERIGAWTGRSRVRWIGEVDDQRRDELLRDTDLFVLPSRYEGFGMAPVEALRYGVPVLATRAGALPEALAGGGALLVEPSAGALRAGIDDAARRLDSLRLEARQAAVELPSWAASARGFAQALALPAAS